MSKRTIGQVIKDLEGTITGTTRELESCGCSPAASAGLATAAVLRVLSVNDVMTNSMLEAIGHWIRLHHVDASLLEKNGLSIDHELYEQKKLEARQQGRTRRLEERQVASR